MTFPTLQASSHLLAGQLARLLHPVGELLPDLAAIEYQGSGHHQGTAATRDAVKKEALRRAGVEYIEVKAGDRTADLNWQIARLAESVEGRKRGAG